MRDEKKPKSKTFYRCCFCILLAVVFLTVSIQTAARARTVFPGNSGLFNPYSDENGLSRQGYMSGIAVSSQAQIEPIDDKPRVSTLKLFSEIFVGMLGNLGGGFLGGVIGSGVIKDDGEGIIHRGAVLGFFPGSILGSALGVYVIGNLGDAKGSFGSALLGSLMGECAAILVLFSFDSNAALIFLVALPPIGAAVFFNSSLKYKSLPVSNALLNFNQGDFKIGIPYVHIQPIPGYAKNVKPTIRFDVNLVNIVF